LKYYNSFESFDKKYDIVEVICHTRGNKIYLYTYEDNYNIKKTFDMALTATKLILIK